MLVVPLLLSQVVLVVGSPIQQVSPPAVVQQATVGKSPELIAAVDKLWRDVEAALALRDAGKEGHGEMLRHAAARLARLGDTRGAVAVLDHVVELPESTFDLLSALRMRGQYLLASGAREQAMRSFEEQVLIFEAEPELRRRHRVEFASGANQYASLLAASGRNAEALRVSQMILAEGTHLAMSDVTAAAVPSAMVNKAKVLRRLGEDAEAAETLAALFESFPEYGRDNGMAVGLRLTLAELKDPTRRTPAYISEIAAVWNDRHLADNPRVITAGKALVQSLTESGRTLEALDAATDVLRRIEANRQLWMQKDAGIRDDDLRTVEVSMLAVLQNADAHGRRDLSAFAHQRLIVLARTPEERQLYLNQLRKLHGLEPLRWPR